MDKSIDLLKASIETNSPLWQIKELEGEQIIQVTGNLEEEHISGKVALVDSIKRNYLMQAELKFLGHHLRQGRGGWFGLVIRARDLENYELVWFMPNAESGKTVAYLSVAHGVVPWWTEAYATQEKGSPLIPHDAWFRVCVDVVNDEMTLYVNSQIVFTKKLTYYLSEGRPGLYAGTATDAAFRRVVIKDSP